MSKKGPLTKIDKFYLDNNLNGDVKELAVELNRTQKFIRSYISENKTEENATPIADLMGHHAQREGITVMPPSASELSDELKPQQSQKRDASIIHKIKDR